MGVKLDLFHDETGGDTFPAGHVVFQEADMGSEMYVVLEGEIELSINGNVVETLGPGEPFGEMALIDQEPRVATAIAKTPCRLLAIPEKRFLFLVSAMPHFSLQIMKVMADRLRKMNSRT
ncbi:Crp/Fnr family transcriptional regulator [Usitatibacter palustris]|uniref:Cyclic nucleotide-gated potassium channel n=1 Tax=Usitatibacter palustris TaxID=2732487 RepID=A0A6M4HB91_9PROT|nr:Crp/Fnr family transcriptional regulator [Usitatibacter palustris]QJR15267.1 Cyclic nucleotide-gated potassium channel [Usitatibacter palustris]